MKKILISSLALSMLVFSGCSYKERCDVTNQAKLEYLWCPRLDSAIVEWMPKVEMINPYYDELADCERFDSVYVPQLEQIRLCENSSLVGKMFLRLGARMGNYKKDSNIVSLLIYANVHQDRGADRPFSDDIANVILDIYGCTAYECKDAEKVHVYIMEGISSIHTRLTNLPKEEKRIVFDKWFAPDSFKIVETNSNPPSSSDGYYRYHHFRLIVDSPSIKTTIETQCDSNCYNTWNTPNVSFPIGG